MIRPIGAIVLSTAVMVLALASRTQTAQAPANKACGLATESELQSALGSAVALKAGALGNVQTCAGETPNAQVLVRFFSRSTDASGNKEQAGIEAAKKMGVQIDVKTSGGITCTTAVPPQNMASMGFRTSCTVTSKAPTFAVIEVTSKTQKDMVPIEKLRSVAEKMAARF